MIRAVIRLSLGTILIFTKKSCPAGVNIARVQSKFATMGNQEVVCLSVLIVIG